MKPFRSLYTDFLIIEDDNLAPLHILYMKSSNFRNPKYIQSFITKMKKKQIMNDKIIKLISSRFGISDDLSREELNDWERIFQNKKSMINKIIKTFK